ncbi:MAG: sulfatase-like hydrolase/transferase [Planctomycetota bacterium]
MVARLTILVNLCFCTAFACADSLPNIILVMADDQGWGDMAYNGHPHVKTPNFDKAAATGLRFDRFYAAAPVCSPTRASVMTGRHPNRMGVFKWGYPMRPQETTIAEALKTVGYTTGHFGKWHLGSVRKDSPANPGRNGFDRWFSAANFYDNHSILSDQGKAVPTKGESSVVAADAALEWIDSLKQDDPFLAVVWFGSPHSPHRAAEEDRVLYDDLPKNNQHFLGEITGMDRAFGKIRNGLEKRGIRDNTILWYCSDNGGLPKVGSTGGRANKGKVYDGGLLVPAILEWPAKIKSPSTTDIRCNTCDIYPTLIEITGTKIKQQAPLDGVSLVGLVNGDASRRSKPMGFWDYPIKGISTPSDAWMTELYEAQKLGKDLPPNEASLRAAELPSPPYSTTEFPGHSALIEGDWKLHQIVGKKGQTKWELYDLSSDKMETTNLIDKRNDVAEKLKPTLRSWLTSVAESLNGDDY